MLVQIYNNRGCLFIKQGDLIKGMSDFNKAIEISPNFVQSYYNRAIAYYLLKEYGNAQEDVHKVVALGGAVSPNFIMALKNESNR